jgi:hypothetical protein
MSEEQIVEQFDKYFINFLDELISQFPKEEIFIRLRISYKDRINPVDTIQYFSGKLLPIRTEIENRNEDFLLNNFSFFTEEHTEEVKYLKKLWRSPVLGPVNKKIIWDWISSFIFLAEKYKKKLIQKNNNSNKTNA